MISAAQLKGTKARWPAGPESFKVKPVHLVSVLIDHRHIILPVQGLICPLNQHLLSTAAAICWKGRKKNSHSLIIPSRCESQPILCSLLSFILLLQVVFSERVSLYREECSALFIMWGMHMIESILLQKMKIFV